MPDAPEKVTSTPEVPGQPYDATDDAPCGKWKSVNMNSGPASMETGKSTGEFEDGGAGGWRQT